MSGGKILAFYAPYTGAGKSTAAKILDSDWSVILSFAEPLYNYARYLKPDLSKKKNKSETYEEFGGKSLRKFLIHFGQAGRDFYQNIWSEIMRKNIYKYKDVFNIIIDDLRFANEYAMLKEEGAKIVRITNPERKIIKSRTEALLEGYAFDYELVNYKRGLEEYRTQLDEMMCELWLK